MKLMTGTSNLCTSRGADPKLEEIPVMSTGGTHGDGSLQGSFSGSVISISAASLGICSQGCLVSEAHLLGPDVALLPIHLVVQERACALLVHVVSGNSRGYEVAKRMLEEAGAVEELDALLRSHDADPNVLGQVLQALRLLVWNNVVAEKVVAYGVPEKVVTAMGRHRAHADLQAHGLNLLISIIFGGKWDTAKPSPRHNGVDAGKMSRAKEVGRSAGGVGCAITAMVSHPASLEVHLAAAHALWAFSVAGLEAKVLLLDNGAVEALASTLLLHVHSASVQTMAIGAMLSLAQDSTANRAQVVREGGKGAVVRALEKQSDINFYGEFEDLEDWLFGKKWKNKQKNKQLVRILNALQTPRLPSLTSVSMSAAAFRCGMMS
ncbi:hypothetical protein CYMTET_32945 [Cymbomonas tetramitiformis]|uniref:Uncharacterized protein n=1 Tax=Cymbomonas tetramitiformis TaxID=36881 RepID=A0AAE0KRF6_9CHLO|nr:hypothetical protein CYMTET_32945 [Cymbomonas tetramitiformis]